MPGYSMHLLSAMYFLNTLHERNPKIEEAIHHNFMLGQILPDLSPWSPTDHRTGHIDVRHFRDPELEISRTSHGIILLSDIDRAEKYLMHQKTDDIKTCAYLAGISFHLRLDNSIFTDYFYKKFQFTGEKVIDNRTGRSYLPNNFVSKKGIGIYNVWDCMAFLSWGELLEEIAKLPEILPPSGFSQYDDVRTTENWKSDMEKFANSARFSKDTIDIDYFQLHDFLFHFANEMVESSAIHSFLNP